MDKSLIIEQETSGGSIAYYKNDRFIVGHLINTGEIFEQDVVYKHLSEIIKQSRVVVDGGAHAGSHTIIYKMINPNLEVHCFEPQSKLFELLSYNIDKNNLSNINLYNLALANIETELRLSSKVHDVVDPWVDPSGEMIFENLSYGGDEEFNLGGIGFGHDGEIVKTTTIDSLDLDFCDFIKLDLEGAEAIALVGAINTIKKFKPTIMFEYNHHQLDEYFYEMFGLQRQTPMEILEALGYTIAEIERDNFLATPISNSNA